MTFQAHGLYFLAGFICAGDMSTHRWIGGLYLRSHGSAATIRLSLPRGWFYLADLPGYTRGRADAPCAFSDPTSHA